MSKNKSVGSVLGSEFTRYIAVSGGCEFYFSETRHEKAIKVAQEFFQPANVFLGLQESEEALYCIGAFEEPRTEESEVEPGVVGQVAKKRGGRNPPRNSNHNARQAAYFFGL